MKKLILTIAIAAGSIMGQAQDAVTFVGHRGASFLAPENTVESVNFAWELGVEAAECDVMLTADNQVIVFHDKKGKRLTGHNFNVSSVTYDEIRDYPIFLRETNLPKYEGATIPLLSDLLKTLAPGRTLVIEIKTGPEILPHLQKVISEYHQAGNIAFIAFDFETINKTKELYPDIPCYYLSMFKGDLKRKFKTIAAGNLDGVNLRHAIVTPELVKKFRDAGKGVWCWTVNDAATAKAMIDAGVTAITTDRPKWLKEQVFGPALEPSYCQRLP